MWGWLRRKRKQSATPEHAPRSQSATPEHAPRSITIVGRIDEITISGRRQYGCLGGDLVFDTPAVQLLLEDGRSVTVEPSTGAVVEGWQQLASPPPPPGAVRFPSVNSGPPPRPTNWPEPPPGTPAPQPMLTGVPIPRITYTALLLGGAIEIRGVVALDANRFAVPPNYRMTVRPLGPA